MRNRVKKKGEGALRAGRDTRKRRRRRKIRRRSTRSIRRARRDTVLQTLSLGGVQCRVLEGDLVLTRKGRGKSIEESRIDAIELTS